MPGAEVKQVKDSLRDAEILVVAPRFPSINQPWMDTYLEQLQQHGIQFAIATSLAKPGIYQEKVDRLRLRDRTILLKLGIGSSVLLSLLGLVARPIETTRIILQALSDLSRKEKLRNRIALALRAAAVHRQLEPLPRLRAIHSHSLAAGQHFIPTTRVSKLPMIVTFHGLEPPGVPQVAAHRRKRLFDAATSVIVNTDFACRHVVDLGCPADKVIVLPQGLPTEDFPFKTRARPEASKRIEILSVGRFQRDKGQAYSILALKRLRDSGLDAAWHFVGVGPDKPRLTRLTQRLNLKHAITFHEGLSSANLLALYQRCHLFVLASRDSRGRTEHVETQGVVLQEAQATGCIPIATRVGGIPECINDGVDGILVRDGSHRAIATAVVSLIARSDDWPKIQQNARRNVEKRFSATVIGNRMASLLRPAMREIP